ncbi:hypothetical protein FNV43_RR00006 [Rhamnella rubrinervis]|uniref:Uncharacterized protein n=1 Tax=Rhamnella rubrinervis TaxID=2594499 RepID=A0A8K0HPR4_9ROSA|nr:hypothetical protein FNV43_RR00006 [Rhamnella rubrinervis]
MKDLTNNVSRLQIANNQIQQLIKTREQASIQIDSKNQVLEAQKMELNDQFGLIVFGDLYWRIHGIIRPLRGRDLLDCFFLQLNMFEVLVTNGSGSYPFFVDVSRNTRCYYPSNGCRWTYSLEPFAILGLTFCGISVSEELLEEAEEELLEEAKAAAKAALEEMDAE